MRCIVFFFLASLGFSAQAQAPTLAVPIVKDCVDAQAACYATSIVRVLGGSGSQFLALRGGPGTQYPILAQLQNGEVVSVITVQDVWFGVELADGRFGWVHSFWLEDLAG